MDNISIFKEFWNSYSAVLLKLYDRTNKNLQVEKLEDLIYETKDVFIKNTQKKTGQEFSSIELAEITKLVETFLTSSHS